MPRKSRSRSARNFASNAGWSESNGTTGHFDCSGCEARDDDPSWTGSALGVPFCHRTPSAHKVFANATHPTDSVVNPRIDNWHEHSRSSAKRNGTQPTDAEGSSGPRQGDGHQAEPAISRCSWDSDFAGHPQSTIGGDGTGGGSSCDC